MYMQKKKGGGVKYTKVNVRFYCGHLGAVDVKNPLNSESARVEAGWRWLPGLEQIAIFRLKSDY